MSFGVYIIVISSGLVGLAVSGYTSRKRFLRENIVCPVGSNCEAVVYSKFSNFLGVPVENFGVFYYLIISVSYTLFLFFPTLEMDVFSFAIISLTILAFIFSIYLTFAQLVVLKEWCSWCFVSAVLCTIIFIAVWSTSDLDIIGFLSSLPISF